MNVTIAAAQYPISAFATWDEWRNHTAHWVSEALDQNAQLLVFPEYGAMELVSLLPKDIQLDIQAQIIELQALRADFCTVFSDLAKKEGVIIVAPSFPVLDNGKMVNRAYVFSSKGLVGHQDKFFMTRFENEEWGIKRGAGQLRLFEADWGSFGIQICYDVEFGVGSQLLSAAGATLVLAPSCTETIRGATRVHIGARARALENQFYTVVSQTVGEALWSPAVDINYGYAGFYSTPDKNMPEEGIFAVGAPHQVGWLTHTLDFSKIKTVREEGQVFNFRDQQRIATSLLEEKIEVVRCFV